MMTGIGMPRAQSNTPRMMNLDREKQAMGI
jgi:hypothetical protein